MSTVARESVPPQSQPSWAWLTGGTALCYLAAALAADVLSYPGSITAIWPASGIAVFAVIAFGYRALAGVLLGVYLNQLSWMIRSMAEDTSQPLLDAFVEHSLIGLSFAAGNVLEAALILLLVRRWSGSGNPLDGVARVVRFIAFAALIGPVTGSLVGTLIICGLWQWTPWTDFWSTLWTWWVSASAGILVIAPPLLFLYYERHVPWRQTRAAYPEQAALVAACTVVVLVAFYWQWPFEYLLLPLLLWSAFRLGPSSTSWLGGAMMLVAAVATTHGHGPFAADDSRLNGTIQSLTLLQCFVATLIATALIVAAVVSEQRRTEENLQQANQSLEARVAARTEELNEARKAAVEANLAKSRFMTHMCHELRTPLNTILGYSRRALSLLSGKADTSVERDIVDRNGERLLNIISDVLHMARIDAGERPPQLELFSLTELLRDVRDAVGLQADEKHIALRMNVDRNVPAVLVSDAKRLHHILVNLLSNAIKFTDHGRVSLEVTDVAHAIDPAADPNTDLDPSIDLSICPTIGPTTDSRTRPLIDLGSGTGRLTQRTYRCIQFRVMDTGIGIDESAIGSIFEPFEQIHTAADGKQGSGLGLSIADQYARSLKSTIRVCSEPGQGSSFTFTIWSETNAEPAVAQATGDSFSAKTLIARSDSRLSPSEPNSAELERLLGKRDRIWRRKLSHAARSGDARATLELLTAADDPQDLLQAWLTERARQYRLDDVVALLQRAESNADDHERQTSSADST